MAKLSSKKRKNSLFTKKKRLVGLAPVKDKSYLKNGFKQVFQHKMKTFPKKPKHKYVATFVRRTDKWVTEDLGLTYLRYLLRSVRYLLNKYIQIEHIPLNIFSFPHID